MKKIICLAVCFAAVWVSAFSALCESIGAPEIESENAVLVNYDTGEVIFSKNPDEKISVASLTKIMTAVVAYENISDLKQTVKITEEDLELIEEKDLYAVGLTPGEECTAEDLLYASCVASSADASFALARTVGGTVRGFCDMMNQKADEMGLVSTHFSNPVGYDDPANYSTAAEIARLFSYAVGIPYLKEILSTRDYAFSNGGHRIKSTLLGAFERYGSSIDAITAAKTGSTEEAGMCLACMGSMGYRNYIFVCCTNKYGRTPYNIMDAAAVFGYYLYGSGETEVIPAGTVLMKIPVSGRSLEAVIKTQNPVKCILRPDSDPSQYTVSYEGVSEITNEAAGDFLGYIHIFLLGKEIYKYPVYCPSEADFIAVESTGEAVGTQSRSNKKIIIFSAAAAVFSALVALDILLLKKKRIRSDAEKDEKTEMLISEKEEDKTTV